MDAFARSVLLVVIGALLLPAEAIFAKDEFRKPVLVWRMAGGGYPGEFDSGEEAFAALNQGLAEDHAACRARPCGSCSTRIFDMPTKFGGPVINGVPTYQVPTSGVSVQYWPACPTTGSPAQGPVFTPWTGTGTDSAWSISARVVCPQGFVGVNSNHHQVTLSGQTANAYDVSCRREIPDPPQCPKFKVADPSCGNPIDAMTSAKLDTALDYAASDGLLRVRRMYSSAIGGWSWNYDVALVDLTGRSAARPPSSDLIASIKMIVGGPYHGTPPPAVDVPKSFPLVKAEPTIGAPSAWVIGARGQRTVFAENSGNFHTLQPDQPQLTVVGVGGAYQWTMKHRDGSFDIFGANGELIAQKFADGKSLTFARDATTLRVTSHPGGRELEYSRSTADLIPGAFDVVTLPDGNEIHYAMNSQGLVTGVTYADSSAKTYLYNEPAYAPPSQSGSAMDDAVRMTGLLDENNVRHATYKYTNHFAVSTELAGGVNKYTFTAFGNRTDILVPPLNVQEIVAFAFGPDDERRFTSRRIPAGAGSPVSTTTFTYDAAGNVSSVVDYRGYRTCFANDATRGVETARVEGMATGCPANIGAHAIPANTRQRKITTEWHPDWNFVIKRAEPRKITTRIYNNQLDPISGLTLNCAAGAPNLPDGTLMAVICKRIEQETTDATGTSGFTATASGAPRVWTYSYNHFGQVLTVDGPRGDVSDVTIYTYYNCDTGYQCGQIATVTNALGHTTTYNTYNAHGSPLTVTDANGLTTTFSYDLRQRLISRSVGDEESSFSYYPTGLLKRVTLPDGSLLEYSYDAAHRLTGIVDGEGNRITYTLDMAGNRTVEDTYDPSNALASTRSRVFDALSRASQEIAAAGTAAVTTSLSYDGNGNQTQINAPLGRNSGQVYDELNRLTQVTDPLTGVTKYGYNALDQLISVSDPRSRVTSYTYNGFGDQTQQVSPDTGTTTNTYDIAGNLLTSTDARNKTATYAYDELNRVTSLSYLDQSISYVYDDGSNQKGRLTQVTDASGSTSWTYDPQGRVLSRQQSMGIAKSVGYAYDLNGRLQTLTLPSGNAVTYGYTDGKITSLTLNGSTTILSDALYRPFGPTRGWTWGNSTLAIREYDTDGLITDIDSAGLKSYGYDDAFRITGITDASNSALSQSYVYDLLDRLTSATATSLNQGWTYDANGNRLTQGGSAASTFTVSSTSNRLSSISGSLTRSYTYDNAGSTTNYGSAAFVYNDAGRMVSATKAGTTTIYALNALGQRVKRTTSGTSRYFVYDESGHLLGEYDNTGALIQETLWLGDTPVATLRPNGGNVSVFYVHSDHLNTPRRITRPSDNVVVWRWDSDPFGTTAANEDPDGDSVLFAYGLRFPGQYFDQETGLSYNYFRDYDPSTGRYIQSDPIGIDGGLNTYLYADANPLSNIDPTGEDAIAVPVPRPVPVPGWAGPAGAVASAGWAGWEVGSAIYPHIAEPLGDLIDKVCQPACNPPKGTVCFIIDRVPPSKPHYPIPGSHYHLWQMNQSPSGQCFWNKLGASGSAPPGAIPCPFTRPSR